MLSRVVPWFAGEAFRPLLPMPWFLDAPVVDGHLEVDILEKDGGLELVCDVPGAGPEDVSVTMENGLLTIRARRASAYANATLHLAERFQGELTRSFQLADAYDSERVSATLHNGVLVVRVGKKPEAAPRKIPISFGAQGAPKQLEGNAAASS